jgi:hemolysin D
MRRVIPVRRAREKRAAELAFLPAALEIMETPPRPLRRAIGATIILLFCAALGWAWWGTIDIVASATGKIVPSGRTKVIQPFETGVVRGYSGAGRAGGQGRRRADRARSDGQRG